jgi:hypothetical protein
MLPKVSISSVMVWIPFEIFSTSFGEVVLSGTKLVPFVSKRKKKNLPVKTHATNSRIITGIKQVHFGPIDVLLEFFRHDGCESSVRLLMSEVGAVMRMCGQSLSIADFQVSGSC